MNSDVELTSLPECFVVEPRLAHLEGVPLLSVGLFVYVDDMQILIHPQLVDKVAHKYSPVLCWIWAFSNLLGYHLAQTRLLSKPFACESGDRMPSYLDDTWLLAYVDYSWGDDIRLLPKSQRMLDVELLLQQFILPLFESLLSAGAA